MKRANSLLSIGALRSSPGLPTQSTEIELPPRPDALHRARAKASGMPFAYAELYFTTVSSNNGQRVAPCLENVTVVSKVALRQLFGSLHNELWAHLQQKVAKLYS